MGTPRAEWYHELESPACGCRERLGVHVVDKVMQRHDAGAGRDDRRRRAERVQHVDARLGSGGGKLDEFGGQPQRLDRAGHRKPPYAHVLRPVWIRQLGGRLPATEDHEFGLGVPAPERRDQPARVDLGPADLARDEIEQVQSDPDHAGRRG